MNLEGCFASSSDAKYKSKDDVDAATNDDKIESSTNAKI